MAEEAKTAEPAAEAQAEQKKKPGRKPAAKRNLYRLSEKAQGFRLVHPYQNQIVFAGSALLEAEEDDWLKAQVEAGLIEKV